MAKVDPIEIAQVGNVDCSVRSGNHAARNIGGVWVRAWDELAEKRAGLEAEFQNLAVIRRVSILIHHQQQIAHAEQTARSRDLVVRARSRKDECSQRSSGANL